MKTNTTTTTTVQSPTIKESTLTTADLRLLNTDQERVNVLNAEIDKMLDVRGGISILTDDVHTRLLLHVQMMIRCYGQQRANIKRAASNLARDYQRAVEYVDKGYNESGSAATSSCHIDFVRAASEAERLAHDIIELSYVARIYR